MRTSSGSGSSGSSSVFTRDFIADQVDGVRDKGSGNTTADMQKILEAFLTMSLRYICVDYTCFHSNRCYTLFWRAGLPFHGTCQPQSSG
jgi:hypothetical protein